MLIAMVWKTLYWTWIVSEVVIALVTRTRRGEGKVQDRGSMLLLWVVIFASIWLGSWAGAAYRPTAIHGAHWIRDTGVALLAAGLAIRWTAILTLGKSFSVNVAIHDKQTLHTAGLFHYMRHPSYTGMMMCFVALGLETRNWLGLGLIVLPPMAALLYRMHVEESALAGAFGPEYVEYRRSTKRLIPGVY